MKELQAITDVEGPGPGQHNWWRGDHVRVYDSGACEQIAKLADIIKLELKATHEGMKLYLKEEL